MDAYVYQAALLCADCAQARIIKVEEMAVKPRGYPSDSNAYPQGPYPQGGGEADTPQHCDDDLLTFAREIADEYDSKKKAEAEEEESD